jgi:hypothetical protein
MLAMLALLYETLCGLFYLIQTATLLGSRFEAVSKIKAFTILIGFRLCIVRVLS